MWRKSLMVDFPILSCVWLAMFVLLGQLFIEALNAIALSGAWVSVCSFEVVYVCHIYAKFSTSGSVAHRDVAIHAPGDTIYELNGAPATWNCTALKTLPQTATTHCSQHWFGFSQPVTESCLNSKRLFVLNWSRGGIAQGLQPIATFTRVPSIDRSDLKLFLFTDLSVMQ